MARIVSGPQASASAANSSRFSPRSSGAASITRSHSARSARLVGRAGAIACRGGVRIAPHPLRDALRQGGVELFDVRTPAPPRRGRAEPGLVAAQGGDLGDARRPSCRRRRHRPARRRSTALELRLALLEEGLHPLDPVLGRHRQLVEAALVLEAGARAPSPRRRAPPAWRAGSRSAAARRSSAASAIASSSQSPSFADLVDEAHPERLVGVEAAAGEDVAPSPAACRGRGRGAACRRRRG